MPTLALRELAKLASEPLSKTETSYLIFSLRKILMKKLSGIQKIGIED